MRGARLRRTAGRWPSTMRPHPRRSSGKKACWTSLLFGARSLRFQGQADRAQLALALRLQRLGGFGRPLERNAQQFASADLAGRLDDQLIAACRKLSERRLAFGKAQDMLAGRAGRAADSVHRHVQRPPGLRSEEHTSELQSLMRISYAVFCLKNKKKPHVNSTHIY